jgi:hypothetical protein
MPADIPDPDFEPEWLWGTRVTAEAARAARAKGRTSQERFQIYERLIFAACAARKRRESPEHSCSITGATASIPGNMMHNYIEVEDNIMISGFETADTDAN